MPEALSSPPIIPDYELLRLVGSGSYGDVWLARSVTGIYRAVKVVWRNRFNEAHPYEREFKGLREFARISLEEPAQLALLHVGRNDAGGFFYYVMELADDVATGRDIQPDTYTPLTLRELRTRRGRLPTPELTRLAVDLTRALAGLHSRGLVHRDIKPANIILVGGTPKLADIGLVTATESAMTFVGTEGFVPPEGPGTPAADIFSLGKMLYELSTGLDRNDYPRLPSELHRWDDRREFMELNEIIIRACEADTRRRYVDATAMLEELLLAQAGRSVRRLRLTEQGLARARRIAVIILLVAGIASLGAYIEHQRANRESAGRRAAEAERDLLARKTVYSATLARAQRALELNAHGQARRLLKELIPADPAHDLRGFEWHALWHEAQGDPAEVIRDEGPTIERTATSPDGRLLAVHDSSKTVTFYDAATRAPLRSVSGVHRLAGFSPDGRWLIGTTATYALQRWSVSDGTPEGPPQSEGINRPMGITPGGQLVVFTDGRPDGEPHAVRLWDFEKKAEFSRFTVAEDEPEWWDFFRCAVSADGRRLALALMNGRAQTGKWLFEIRSLPSGELLYEEPFADRISALALSPDGGAIAAALSNTNEILLWESESRNWRWRVPVGRGEARSLVFSKNGEQIAAGGHDSVLRILARVDGTITRKLTGQSSGIAHVEWLSDTDALIAAGNAGDLREWSLQAPQQRREISGLWMPAAGGRSLAISHNGTYLALCPDGLVTKIFSTDTLQPLATLGGLQKPIAFSENGSEIIGVSTDSKIQHWRWLSETLLGQTPLTDGSPLPTIRVTSWAQQSQIWAVSDTSGTLYIGGWPIELTRTIRDRVRDSMSALTLSQDGQLAFTAGNAAPQASIWDVGTGTLRSSWRTLQPIKDFALLPQQATVAVALENGNVELRSLDSPQLFQTLSVGEATAWALAFSPDGNRLFIGGADGIVHIMDTGDWREVLALGTQMPDSRVGESKIAALAMSADSSTLAAYLSDGRLRVWKIQHTRN